MSELKYLMFTCALCCLGTAVEAKVCFLGSGDEFCKSTSFSLIEKCPECTTCDVPKSESAKCDCSTEDQLLYKPEDCCSSGGRQKCESPKECVSNGSSTSDTCTAMHIIDIKGVKRKVYSDYCLPSQCKCPSKYHFCKNNSVGGEDDSCTDSEGTKYASCTCPTTYTDCSKVSYTEGVGRYCIGDDNVKMYTQCPCEETQAPYQSWSTTVDKCVAESSCEVCQSYKNGSVNQTYYSCPLPFSQTCQCSASYDSNGCQTGCTDDNYSYIGTGVGISGTTRLNAGNGNVCISGTLCCSNGYWDPSLYITSTATTEDAQIKETCNSLGYTTSASTACSGDSLFCPFSVKYKTCLE